MCLRIDQQNITKRTMKGYKKGPARGIKSFQRRKKKKKQDYGQKQYQNLFEDDKEKLIGYRKNYLKGLQITGTYNSFLLPFSVA